MMEASVGGVIGKPITPFMSSTALPIALQECRRTACRLAAPHP